MKKLALLVLTLSACASNQDPMSPLKNGQAVKSSNAEVAAAPCVNLTGRYLRADGHELLIDAKLDGAVPSYRVGGEGHDYVAADGSLTNAEIFGAKITSKATCDTSSLMLTGSVDGKAANETFSLLPNGKLLVTGTDDKAATVADAGTYVKQ
jgi:hypothetical protein